MWRHGEDGQEARTVQKLPETGVRPVAQEQVGFFLVVVCITHFVYKLAPKPQLIS